MTRKRMFDIAKTESLSSILGLNAISVITNREQEQALFEFNQSQNPVVISSQNKFWDEEILLILHNATDKMGISSYSPSVSKNNNSAILKSHRHLFDLLKYYEGDRYYYYEGVTLPFRILYLKSVKK